MLCLSYRTQGCGAIYAALTMTAEEFRTESEHVQLLISRSGAVDFLETEEDLHLGPV